MELGWNQSCYVIDSDQIYIVRKLEARWLSPFNSWSFISILLSRPGPGTAAVSDSSKPCAGAGRSGIGRSGNMSLTFKGTLSCLWKSSHRPAVWLPDCKWFEVQCREFCVFWQKCVNILWSFHVPKYKMWKSAAFQGVKKCEKNE